MRVVKIGPPWAMYWALVPLAIGIPFAVAGRWTPASILFASGLAWQTGSGLLFSRRVSKLRAAERLTSRDLVEIDYPGWARRGASRYVRLLAAMTGMLIVLAVIVVIAAVATE